MTTCRLMGYNVPVSGGGYFRLFPYRLTWFLLRRVNKLEDKPFVFYLHPWEIDPEIPKVNDAGVLSRFRTYNNLHKTENRLKQLLSDFHFSSLSNVLSL